MDQNELRKRMALARKQGWSEDEIQRSAAMEQRMAMAQAQAAAPQDNGGGSLGEALLNFIPFGNIVRKAATGEQISPGELVGEAAMTAIPFGLGKIAKVAKAAKAANSATKLAKAAPAAATKVADAVEATASTPARVYNPSRIPYANKATKQKQIDDLLSGVNPDESNLPIQNGGRVPFVEPGQAAETTAKAIDRGGTLSNVNDLTQAATSNPNPQSPESLLNRTADNLSRVATIAPTSTLDSALQQGELVDLVQRIPELRGSGARKFQNVEGVISKLMSQVDETIKDVPNRMPVDQFNKSFDTVASSLTGPDRANFERFLNRAKNRVFGRRALPEQISPTQVNGMLREVNGQLSGIFRKKQMGTTLTAQDEGLLSLYEELQDQLYGLLPENLQPVVRQLNKDQSTLIKAIPEFKKTSEQRINIMGMTLPGSKLPYRAVQAGADYAARGMTGASRMIPQSPLVRGLAAQAGVRAGADALGLRGDQEPTEDPSVMLSTLPGAGLPPDALLGGDQQTQSPLQQALAEDFIKTGGENAKMLQMLYGGGQKMSSAQQKQLMGTSTANSIVDQIEGELSGLAKQGNVGRVGGLIGQIQGTVGLNDAVRSYEDTRGSKALMIIKAIMGSAGSISDADRAAIEGSVPSAMDTAGERARKIASLRQIISAYEGGAMAGSQSPDDLLSQLSGL